MLCCVTPSFPSPPYRRAEAGSYTLLCFFFPPPPPTWCYADLVPTDRSWASSAVIRPIPLHGMNMSGLGPPARLTNTATRCVDLHAPLGSEQVMRRFVCICKPKPTAQWSPTDRPPSKQAPHQERESVWWGRNYEQDKTDYRSPSQRRSPNCTATNMFVAKVFGCLDVVSEWYRSGQAGGSWVVSEVRGV